MTVRSRIVEHVTVRAGDLVPHELNPRTHSDAQREALAALYDEVGFARSLLAYRLADGRLKLIDGHLRASMDPDQEVTVEVLDVTDAEARALLLSIDPLAQLADYDTDALDVLRAATSTASAAVHNLWQSVGAAQARTEEALSQAKKKAKRKEAEGEELVEQFLVIVTCKDEAEQVKLLKRFKGQGLKCKAVMS